MTVFHHILAIGHKPLRCGNAIGRRVGVKPSGSLRVLIYHDIPLGEQEKLAVQLRWLAREWRFVSADQYAAMVEGDEPIQGRNLLLTFDDGFISNRWVADAVLSPLGIRALFFVATDFIDFEDSDASRGFVTQRLWPGVGLANVPAHWRNMNWNDLRALLEDGHTIGAHTRSHARLSELKTEAELVAEIVASGDRLESELGVRIQHFAFPFGNLASFSPTALSVARRRFSFIHSGLRGDNVKALSPWLVRRDAISPRDTLNLVGALLEGGADFLYARDVAKLDVWRDMYP